MTSVSDTYNDAQGPNSILPSSGVTQWTPAPGFRTTNSVGASTSTIAAGILSLGSAGGNGGILVYNYAPFPDFTGIVSISMTAILPAFAVTNINLTITDGTATAQTVLAVPVGGVWTWPLASFGTLNLTSVIQILFQSDTAATGTNLVDLLSSLLVCVAKDTKVMMLDRSERNIQDVRRGDLVLARPDGDEVNRVARVNMMQVDGRAPLDIIRIDSKHLGTTHPLLITGNHPIIYDAARRPARCFRKFEGVKQFGRKSNIQAKDILPRESDGSFKVYDLQFEKDASYVANGLTVQSRSPRSDITPLPKELYFDQSLWTEKVVWDVLSHPLPLNTEEINENKAS